MTFNKATAVKRAEQLWDRASGPWAVDVNGNPVLRGHFSDIHSPLAVSFNRTGAILRAIEEQVGVGNATSPQFVSVQASVRGYKSVYEVAS